MGSPLRSLGSPRRQQEGLLIFGVLLTTSTSPPRSDDAADAADSHFTSSLPSAYPEGTPAGLRGEAVRSALRSGQSVGWNLNCCDELQFGVVQAVGEGVLEFCNNKFTQSFVAPLEGDDGSFQEACWLNARGRLMDRVGVAISAPNMAFLVTSPGHSASSLFASLDPFIFPLDQVALTDWSDSSFVFSLSSVRCQHVQSAFEQYVWPLLSQSLLLETSTKASTPYALPPKGKSLTIPLLAAHDNNNNNGDQKDKPNQEETLLLIIPTSGLPDCAMCGYTFAFLGAPALGERIWEQATSAANPRGPVAVGPREFETIRIESGQAAFGREINALQQQQDGAKKSSRNAGSSSSGAPNDTTPATPLELHLGERTIDTEKGCYLGQEGIAAILKNPRGPPRSLYQVIFEDDFNIYDYESAGDRSRIANKTRMPRVGDRLFVLGSNESIAAGVLTSVAEPGSTGEPETVALALIRRADSILKQMRNLGLEMQSPSVGNSDSLVVGTIADVRGGSGIISPPPSDPLDGLEVIVGQSFTVGKLCSVPSRRLGAGQTLYNDGELDFGSRPVENEFVVESNNLTHQELDTPPEPPIKDDDENGEAATVVDAAKAEAEAQATAAEAKRKAEKMEMLRKQAEAAMARRKKNKERSTD